jgi:hypothetical protein
MTDRPETGQSLIDVVKRSLSALSLNYTEIEGRTALTLNVRAEEVTLHCTAQTDEDRRNFVFVTEIDARVPEAKRGAIAEYITRANFGLIHGSFEMDLRDGLVRYKTTALAAGGPLSEDTVTGLIRINFGMWDRYFAGLMAVVYGSKEPALAIAEAERSGAATG